MILTESAICPMADQSSAPGPFQFCESLVFAYTVIESFLFAAWSFCASVVTNAVKFARDVVGTRS